MGEPRPPDASYDYSRWTRIKSLFSEALTVPIPQREDWLRSNCEDAGIEAGVRRLLDHHSSQDRFHEDWAEPASQEPSFREGDVLAQRFRIICRIGVGGMGEVYEAEDSHTGTRLAIKALRPEFAADAALITRFLRELQVSRSIAHPNVCRVLEFYPAGDPAKQRAAFFTMELLEGETLAQRIARKGKLTPAEALPIISQVAAGLAEVHSLQIIHRDLKPANIMLVPDRTRGERAVVMDFGLARSQRPGMASDTRSGALMGTPVYMAPEQFQRGELTVACDVYAFGVTIFEMLTGTSHPLVPLRTAAPDIESDWDETLLRCFSADPAKRPQSVSEVVEALEDAATSSEASGIARRRRRTLFRSLIALTTLAAVAILVWLAKQPPPLPGPVNSAVKVTYDNFALDPAGSADGKYLVYASDRFQRATGGAGYLNIWMTPIANADPRPLTTDKANEDQPALSPNDRSVAYHSRTDKAIFLKPVDGGAPQLIARWGQNPRFSPDGRSIIYWTGQEGEYGAASGRIWLVPSTGGEPRQLAPSFADARYPVWSPDGHILFRGARSAVPSLTRNLDWWITDASGSTPAATLAYAYFRRSGLTPYDGAVSWDGKHVFFSARAGSTTDLWRIALPSGERQVKGDADRVTEGELAVTPALLPGGRLAYSMWHGATHIWRLRAGSQTATPLNLGEQIDVKPSVSADGRLIVFANRVQPGSYDICRADLSVSLQCQTHFPAKSYGFLSPDGRTIAVLADHTVELKNAAGEQLRSYDCPNGVEIAGWRPDGKAILLRSRQARDVTTISILDLKTGANTDLLSLPGLHDAVFSPDGQALAYSVRRNGVESRIFLKRLGQGSANQNAVPLTPPDFWSDSPAWSPEGNDLDYMSDVDGFTCVWERSINRAALLPEGAPRELKHIPNGSESPFALSHDDFALVRSQDFLFFGMGRITGNVWILKVE